MSVAASSLARSGERPRAAIGVLHFTEVIGQIIFYKAAARCGSGIGSRAALVNGELPAVHLDANQQAVVNFRFAAKEAF